MRSARWGGAYCHPRRNILDREKFREYNFLQEQIHREDDDESDPHGN